MEVAEWGPQACRGGGEEVLGFESAPICSVELSGGAGGKAWRWHLRQCLSSAALDSLASRGSWWAGAGKGGSFCLCSGLVAGMEIVWV